MMAYTKEGMDYDLYIEERVRLCPKEEVGP